MSKTYLLSFAGRFDCCAAGSNTRRVAAEALVRSSGRSDVLRNTLLPYTRPWNVVTLVSIPATYASEILAAKALYGPASLGIWIVRNCSSTTERFGSKADQLTLVWAVCAAWGAWYKAVQTSALQALLPCFVPLALQITRPAIPGTLDSQSACRFELCRQALASRQHKAYPAAYWVGKYLQISLAKNRKPVNGQKLTQRVRSRSVHDARSVLT